MALSKQDRRNKIRMRIRKEIVGTAERPRLSVFRSNKEIYAQLVDDVEGKTLAAATKRNNEVTANEGTKQGVDAAVGNSLAERALKAGIESVSFDRGGYLYHGRVKSLADGAREGGLKF